jgi:hypothetical protein
VGAAFEREDMQGILTGLFDANRRLSRIQHHLAAIRTLLGEEPDEEEDEEKGDEGAD